MMLNQLNYEVQLVHGMYTYIDRTYLCEYNYQDLSLDQ